MSLSVFLVLAAFCIALLTGWLMGRRRGISVEPALTSMLLFGLLGARLAFVVQYLDDYTDQPQSVLHIADGGFSVAGGVLSAVITGAIYAWRHRTLRQPLAIALTWGVAAWAAMGGIIGAMHSSQTGLSDRPLAALEGQAVSLSSFKGKPVVVNLWATWCPPCRREMPVLSRAQQNRPDIVFVFVNQGEHPETVRQYLSREQLPLANVLLDPGGELMRQLGTNGLPSTFFFNARGELADTHFGELSSATLKHNLRSFQTQ